MSTLQTTFIQKLGAGTDAFEIPANDGTSGQYLQTDGTGGLSWAGVTTGKILQVVSATTNTQVTNTTSTYADSGLTDSITPVAAGSSILVLTSQSFFGFRTGNAEGVRVQLVRGSTVIFGADAVDQYIVVGGAASVYLQARNAMTYLDTPSYTLGDTITYKTQFRPEVSEARAQSGSQESSIVLMEVAA